MNIDTICQQLREMRLTHMANQLVDRIANGDHIDLPHEQFIGLLVEDEYLYRQKRRLNRMITNARFKPEQPSIEDITYSNKRRLMKKDIMQFTTTQWIDNTQNLILTGKTGCGKSFIAQAVALQACRMGYPALNIRYNML
ncbi:MAG: ATP-binding protein, partial [Chitinispirillia bacterium]